MATRGRPRKPRPLPALNALDHGIMSSIPVIPEVERLEDWQAHFRGLVTALEPAGDAEIVLTHRVALTLWRLNRVITFELHALRPDKDYLKQLKAYSRKALAADPDATVLPIRSFPFGSSIDRIQRYEAHLHRIFLKACPEEVEGTSTSSKPSRPVATATRLLSLASRSTDDSRSESRNPATERCPFSASVYPLPIR